MRLFVEYLKQRRRILMTTALFCLIFAISFGLYHLPIKAVLYPALWCLVLGVGMMIVDFLRVKKRHLLLTQIREWTDLASGSFPKTEGIEERDYQQIIQLLGEEYQESQTRNQQKYADMIDYYTVWAHQIKTPIASMRLHLQNEDSVFSRQFSADLFRVEQYVEMVLTFLRLDSDSSDYLIKEYDLDTIIRGAVKKFAGEFIRRKLKLVYEPVNVKVITDEKWLSFVVEQVISNALKYTPSGSVTITFTPEQVLCIQDTGIGIAPEDLPRIFENGFTGYNGRSDKKASGIGLYLCRRICKNLGHEITAQSVVGQGTQIKLDLSQEKLEVE